MNKRLDQKLNNLKVGDPVECNGFPGVVARVLDGKLAGMVEVRLAAGLVCVSATVPNVIPE